MKKSDIQSQVVVMCGISGSGKTHFARQLEKEGYIRLSLDAIIWKKIGSELFSLSKEEQRKIFAECKLQLREQLSDLLESGKKIVVDATHCSRSARDELRKLCEMRNLKTSFVYCYADKEELWNRLSRRKGDGPDDLIVTQDELNDYWNGFELPQEDETDFIIFKN